MDQLKVTETKKDRYTLLTIEGSLNSYTYSDFQNKLYELIEKTNVVVEMTNVSNLSSAGLGVLMSAIETGEEKGYKLYILKPSEVVKLAIESTGFSDHFNSVQSESEAQW
jgi:anti-anti-sigma factor